jgi:hypothetical protein
MPHLIPSIRHLQKWLEFCSAFAIFFLPPFVRYKNIPPVASIFYLFIPHPKFAPKKEAQSFLSFLPKKFKEKGKTGTSAGQTRPTSSLRAGLLLFFPCT